MTFQKVDLILKGYFSIFKIWPKVSSVYENQAQQFAYPKKSPNSKITHID